MLNKLFLCLSIVIFSGCANTAYQKTVPHVDINKFMKKWYVIAGRFTWMEEGAHNAVEEYRYNPKEQRIDINFYFNQDSFQGPVKKIPQKAWVEDQVSNAYWKVSPFWPLKFDYLVIALAEDYSWTVIGVPSQKYIWIMAERWEIGDEELRKIIEKVELTGYSVKNIERLPQKWK